MTTLETRIESVTVHPKQALVTRRGRLQLEAGTHEVSIDDLVRFMPESVRVSGRGPAGTRILGVDVNTAFHGRAPEPELERLREEIDSLVRRQQLLGARRQALDDRRQWLRSVGEQSREFARGLAQGQIKAEDCAALFAFMADRHLEDAEATQVLEREETQLEETIEARRRELERRQGGENPDRQSAVIGVDLAETGELELELSYMVAGAVWHPRYDVRVEPEADRDAGRVHLQWLGVVTQRTREDWSGVELALSTARPHLAGIPLRLDPWFLVERPAPVPMPAAPQRAFAAAKLSKRSTAMSANVEANAEQMVEFAAHQSAEVDGTGPNAVFRVGQGIDVPSDGSPHQTTIMERDLPAVFDRVCVPSISEEVQVHTRVTNDSESVLLSGEIHVFQGGEYLGTTRLAQVAPGETFDLHLGVDDRVRVRRELVERAVDRGTILQGGIRRTTFGYRITVRNFDDRPHRVVLRDRIPVSQHERIKVRPITLEPEPKERTDLEVMTWELDLKGGEERVLRIRFGVEHPAGLEVEGLPPRLTPPPVSAARRAPASS
ncbi:MAG TPA: DUF4139 domain-containing protein [Candidatus Dormibacteraeota bacterium]|jgi:uncharacterized protein (TIGR02231 family)|nr:DUF4139 domain-containing protein [Candidatus Dormibacteraeota bacterium]